MQVGVQVLHEKALSESNHGQPELRRKIYTGRPGRPRYELSTPFLEDALQLRSVPGVARFLDVSTKTLERRMGELGMRKTDFTVPFPLVKSLVEFWCIQRPGIGSKMLRSTIRTRYGLKVSKKRILLAIREIDPTRSLFRNVPVHRRAYSVPGPNALWHHDGQHGRFISHLDKFLLLIF